MFILNCVVTTFVLKFWESHWVIIMYLMFLKVKKINKYLVEKFIKFHYNCCLYIEAFRIQFRQYLQYIADVGQINK